MTGRRKDDRTGVTRVTRKTGDTAAEDFEADLQETEKQHGVKLPRPPLPKK